MDSEQVAAIKQNLKDEGFNIYVYSYPGGMCFPQHLHEYDVIHVVLSGSMVINMDETDFVLVPGERFLVPANRTHSAEVLGESPVVILDATKPK